MEPELFEVAQRRIETAQPPLFNSRQGVFTEVQCFHGTATRQCAVQSLSNIH